MISKGIALEVDVTFQQKSPDDKGRICDLIPG